MVNRYLWVAFVVVVWHQSTLADTVAPLKNGYSAVEPQTAALLKERAQNEEALAAEMESVERVAMQVEQEKISTTNDSESAPEHVNEQRLSLRLEQGADKILSSKDGVSAALGAALTATVSSNPATVLVGGLAGIWAGEQKLSHCGCESDELGSTASNLFRTVSKTFFKGSRALLDGSKKLAKKTGLGFNKLRYANEPMPMQGQVSRKIAEAEAPVKQMQAQQQPEMLPVPVEMREADKKPVEMKPVMQQPVISSVKKMPAPAKKEMPAPVQQPIVAKRDSEKSKPVMTERPAEEGPVAQVVAATKPSAKSKPAEKKKIVTKSKEETILRANTKKLASMPKLEMEETLPAEKVSAAAEEAWPEQTVQKEQMEMPVHRVLKAESSEPEKKMMSAYTPLEKPEDKVVATIEPTADCDAGGNKISRGRLAWMECYYRMDQE